MHAKRAVNSWKDALWNAVCRQRLLIEKSSVLLVKQEGGGKSRDSAGRGWVGSTADLDRAVSFAVQNMCYLCTYLLIDSSTVRTNYLSIVYCPSEAIRTQDIRTINVRRSML